MSLRRLIVSSFIQKSRVTSYFVSITVREQRQRYDKNNEDPGYYKIGGGVMLGSVLYGASSVSDKKEKTKSWHLNTVKAEDCPNEAEDLPIAAEECPNEAKDLPIEAEDCPFEAGAERPDLPTYRFEEVCQHDSKCDFWVTYKHGVYDVTSFLPSHPGGEQIYNAAGGSIEPFWSVYGMHKTEEVFRLLETYRIGNLHCDDIVDHSDDELWAKEPFRDKRLIIKTAKPFNAEIPPQCQIEHFDTPNELFYVRQHLPVPDVNPATHKLRVTRVGRSVVSGAVCREFTLEQLSKFRKGRIRAALMCAGNRRSEMSKEVTDKDVKGISWAGGAISSAVWSGVYLRDVLLHCGVDEADVEGKHVIFQGADIDATGTNFNTSIPLSMALNPRGDILLATHMNGKPLPPDHGYPLRVVVPGAPAVRSVKWLESITVSDEESSSHWHKKDYRSFNSSKTWETADFESAPPVYSLPVTSAICEPEDCACATVSDGHITARGYAYSGGGAQIVRVDLSPDQGATWYEAELMYDCAPPSRHYAWTLWTISLPVQKQQTEMELWVKATDSNFNTQPEKFEHIWNIRGLLSNAYHKIKIGLKHC